MKRTAFIVVAFVLLLSLLLAASPQSATSTQQTPAPEETATGESKYGGVLKLALTVGPGTPIGYPPEAAPDAQDVGRPCLETLFRIKERGELEPLLATGWEVSPDRSSITLTLRRGVKFHDGTNFNAEAVKWNLGNMIEARKGGKWKSVDLIDKYTVRVNLKGYANTDLTNLGQTRAQMISPTAVKENGLDWARWHPVGTGPFKFVKFESDSKLVYEKNGNYWQENKPYLDGVEYQVIPDETVRNMAFQRGDIHVLEAIGKLANDLQKKGYEYRTRSGGTFVLIPDSKNTDSPFSDKRVRQAVSYAIDRESLVQAVGYGLLRPAYQIAPGSEVTKVPDLAERHYDQDKARQLVNEAGYPDGFKTTIHTFLRIVPRDYITAIAHMLAKVGIEVDTDFPEAGRYTEYRFRGWNNAMMAHCISPFANMNRCFSFYFGGRQFPSVQKPEGWEKAYNEALSSTEIDPVKTQNLVKLMQETAMVIPYAEETKIRFFQDGVHDTGYMKDDLHQWYPENAWLEPALR